MSQETPKLNTQNTWLVFSTLSKLGAIIDAITNWFAKDFENFPDNETGELMRRYMADKSWFDEISSAWVKRSFFEKITFIGTVTLGTGLFGIILSFTIVAA